MTNEQEAFNTIWAGIKAQGCPSMDPGGVRCAYRGRHATKCAVGWLIPDDQYLPELDGVDSSGTPPVLAVVVGKVPALKKYNSSFLEAMQLAHDIASSGKVLFGIGFMDEWKRRMRAYASANAMTVPEDF